MQPELFSDAHDGSGVVEDHVPVIERMANEVAEARLELEGQKKHLADLLRHVGLPSVCGGPRCKQNILLIYHKATSGALTPYNIDGTNHFGTCVDRELFKRRK
jgi:hypothetical protein